MGTKLREVLRNKVLKRIVRRLDLCSFTLFFQNLSVDAFEREIDKYETAAQAKVSAGMWLACMYSHAFVCMSQGEYVEYPFLPHATAARIDYVKEMQNRTDPDVYKVCLSVCLSVCLLICLHVCFAMSSMAKS